MSQEFAASGVCLCGSVQVVAPSLQAHIGACHCGMCRKWNGGPFLTVECSTDMKIEGKSFITTYNSSEWAERSFCSRCGTHLFYHLKGTPKYFVSSQLFENANFEFEHQIFIDKKPSYYSFANKTINMTEAEVFAMYSQSTAENDPST